MSIELAYPAYISTGPSAETPPDGAMILDSAVASYLDQQVQRFLAGSLTQPPVAQFLPPAGDRFRALREGNETEFLSAARDLAVRVQASMNARTAPGLLLALRIKSAEGVQAGVLKFGVSDGVVLSRRGQSKAELRAVGGLLETPGPAPIGVVTPDLLHNSAIAVGGRLPYTPHYFLDALGIRFVPDEFVESGLLGPDGRPIDLESRTGQLVLADVRTISDQMIVALQHEPELLFKLDPRRFEELVAELLSRMGYSIELTPPTRDGGKDIYATRRDGLGTVVFLVEAKRYAPRHLVGIEIVQRLHGVVSGESGTGGVVVTTSGFTKPARTFQQRDNVRRQLSLRDYRDLQDWLADARKGNPAARRI